ncbi:hypothetical protein WN943_001760 [Citrus x changshan-huyou]
MDSSSSSSSASASLNKTCQNCKSPAAFLRPCWRLRTGGLAMLCVRCAYAFSFSFTCLLAPLFSLHVFSMMFIVSTYVVELKGDIFFLFLFLFLFLFYFM